MTLPRSYAIELAETYISFGMFNHVGQIPTYWGRRYARLGGNEGDIIQSCNEFFALTGTKPRPDDHVYVLMDSKTYTKFLPLDLLNVTPAPLHLGHVALINRFKVNHVLHTNYKSTKLIDRDGHILVDIPVGWSSNIGTAANVINAHTDLTMGNVWHILRTGLSPQSKEKLGGCAAYRIKKGAAEIDDNLTITMLKSLYAGVCAKISLSIQPYVTDDFMLSYGEGYPIAFDALHKVPVTHSNIIYPAYYQGPEPINWNVFGAALHGWETLLGQKEITLTRGVVST